MSGDCCSCEFQDTAYLAGSCVPSFALFMGLLEYILRQQCNIAQPCSRAGKMNQRLVQSASFDYIVVGAGAAGSVVASRLGELNVSVLVLEAGPEEPTATQVPGFAFNAVGTPLDWNYTTQPQEKACLADGGVCQWPRGKMVGGTFPMNGMMYSRGHPSIYDSYTASGNDGWSYDDVLPYFKKAEGNRNPEMIDDGYHGFDGPLVVQRFSHHPELAASIVKAGEEIGYRAGDFSGRNQTGIGIIQVMVSDGLRGSTSRMYLREASKRGNVQVMTNTQVTKVLIGQNGRALGVEYLDEDGVLSTVLAREEVILSAGTIGSPHILLLSGIGPAEDLDSVGIEVLQDLPVGKNLHNHVGTFVSFVFNDTFKQTLTLDAFNQFLRQRDGPLASTGLTQLTGFLHTKYSTNSVADIQLFLDGYSMACARTGMSDECEGGEIGSCQKRKIIARPTNILPRSKGYLKLNSSNPLDHPLIFPNYFADPIDEQILLDGIRLAKQLFGTETLRLLDFEMDRKPVKGCEKHSFDSEPYWQCVIRRYTEPENHQAGTCKMGPTSDPSTVVDAQLRVHGIPNLRVIDASIFPMLPNGNPISMIVMVAEKGSDMIKDVWFAKNNATLTNSTSTAGIMGRVHSDLNYVFTKVRNYFNI